MVKVDVISGFLGAGKTTLIKKMFETVLQKEKVVLIENEFGEIGIDGSFLKESGIEIKEINAGCICCSLVGDFETSMQEVITKFNPERIIIEPSGVGKLSDIVNAILRLKEQLQINVLATVVDGPKTKMYLKNFGEFFLNQVEAANTIIVSKVDKMDEQQLADVVEIIKNKNDHATVITTAISDLDSAQLMKVLESKVSLKEELIEEMKHVHEHEDDDEECCCHHEHHHHDDDDEECCCHHEHHEHDEDGDEESCCHHEHHDEHHEHHHHHHHDADEIFTSWGKETVKSVSKQELEAFLEKLATDESLGIIVRSKGILKASDNEKWYYYDFVSGDYEIRLGNPDYTGRIVVIGSKIDEAKIESLFFNGK